MRLPRVLQGCNAPSSQDHRRQSQCCRCAGETLQAVLNLGGEREGGGGDNGGMQDTFWGTC